MSKSDYVTAGRALQKQHEGSAPSVLAQRKSYFDARLSQIAKWVRGGIRPEALVRFLLHDLAINEKLRMCTPESLYLGLLACATTGLVPGSLHAESWLVPFAGKAQFMAGYRGYIKLAKRSGEVSNLFANVVHARDVFDIDLGSDPKVVHKPALGDRGEPIGVYAVAKMNHGVNEIEWLSDSDVDRIRKVADSRGKSPAWKEWPEEMAKKSAIRRIAKRLPMGEGYITAKAIEDAQEEKGDAKEVLDLETDGAASQVESAPQIQIDEPAFDPSTDIPS